ncbi:SHOCT domain-containing protein [Nakamurella sp.]|uniref:SHOCT domain-containing protein n=1 Tax=Nakamurella sp. TaxID=1869182 RepID=UPI003784D06B
MGLFKTAAKVAVASSVHGRVQRRQQQRWAAQDAAPAAAPPPPVHHAPPPPPAPPAPAASGVDMATKLAQLQQLADLKTAGLLSDAEVESQKAAILAQ